MIETAIRDEVKDFRVAYLIQVQYLDMATGTHRRVPFLKLFMMIKQKHGASLKILDIL